MIKKLNPKIMKPIVPIFQRPGKDRDSEYKHTDVSTHEESFLHVCMHERIEKCYRCSSVNCLMYHCNVFLCKKKSFLLRTF